MSKDDKQRILATNRLLEILRAERNSEDSVESDDSVIDSGVLQSVEGEELQYKSKSETGEAVESDQPLEPSLASLFTDVEPTDDSPPATESVEETAETKAQEDEQIEDVEETVEEISQEEEVIAEKEELSEEAVDSDEVVDDQEQELDPDVAKLVASIGIESEDEESASDYSVELKDDLLTKTELQKDEFSAASNELVMAPEFNDSLITYFEETEEAPDWKYRLKYLQRYFLDNRRKITFYVDGNTIYFLQTLARLKETKIEKVKSYSLPYEYGSHMITGINDLLSHILENEVEEKDKNSAFGAYFSMNTPSKTITIKSPKLKSNELKELVEWNANKNLPFSTESKNLNYRIIKTGLDADTNDVIIGVTETDSVNSIENIFKRNNLKLIYTSTLPILLWKSFIKNYPERDIGSYVIVHIGEARTLVIVVSDHVLQFSRKIALGAQDFYKAVLKKVEVNETGDPLDNTIVKDLLSAYGYPQNLSGLTSTYNIDLNKVTIAVRPVVERIVSELSRTLNYFKNQRADLEWKQLLFDGVAASFPGLLEAVQESIFQQVEILNPMRTGEYILAENNEIRLSDYPNYVMNFALASDEAEDFNVATKNIREKYKYSFRSKITIALLAMMVPVFIFSSLYNSISLSRDQKAIKNKQTELERLAVDTKDYASFLGDIDFINSTNHFLRNDRTYAENQVRVLKLFSSIVPEEIKLTALNFVNAAGLPDSIVTNEFFKEHLEVSGFVNQDKSVADIYLADFILELEKLRHFSEVLILEKNENEFSANSELFFKLRLDLKQ